jgi:hypothetical protein
MNREWTLCQENSVDHVYEAFFRKSHLRRTAIMWITVVLQSVEQFEFECVHVQMLYQLYSCRLNRIT